MEETKRYTIAYRGLRSGLHDFHFKVDGKGRMALPAKFRKVLSKDLVVTPELTNECVYVFETPDFNEWVEKLFIDRFGEYKESDREHVKLRRVLKSRARDVEAVSYTHLTLPTT